MPQVESVSLIKNSMQNWKAKEINTHFIWTAVFGSSAQFSNNMQFDICRNWNTKSFSLKCAFYWCEHTVFICNVFISIFHCFWRNKYWFLLLFAFSLPVVNEPTNHQKLNLPNLGYCCIATFLFIWIYRIMLYRMKHKQPSNGK